MLFSNSFFSKLHQLIMRNKCISKKGQQIDNSDKFRIKTYSMLMMTVEFVHPCNSNKNSLLVIIQI